MTGKERKALARNLAETLNEYSTIETRRAVIRAKERLGDLIYDEQGFPEWSQFEAEWREAMK